MWRHVSQNLTSMETQKINPLLKINLPMCISKSFFFPEQMLMWSFALRFLVFLTKCVRVGGGSALSPAWGKSSDLL